MTDLKTSLETPYLDKEIKRYQQALSFEEQADCEKLQEYQKIKAALWRLVELEDSKFRMPYASDLKAMRKNLWLSMGQVQEACGVSKSTISRIEKGYEADYSNVKKLVDFYQSQPLPNNP